MVLFICNYEFDTDKLERALSSLIDIIFSGGLSFYHKYEIIELLYLSRQSSSANIISTNILVMFLCCYYYIYIAPDIWIETTMQYCSSYILHIYWGKDAI